MYTDLGKCYFMLCLYVRQLGTIFFYQLLGLSSHLSIKLLDYLHISQQRIAQLGNFINIITLPVLPV